MKIFICTKAMQGKRATDFCFVPEGEALLFGFECDRDRCNVDGRCGCRRALVGMVCSKATTTFTVADRPDLTKDKFIHDYLGSLQDGGWLSGGPEKDKTEAIAAFTSDAEELLELATFFQVGDVLEKRGNRIQTRSPNPILTP